MSGRRGYVAIFIYLHRVWILLNVFLNISLRHFVCLSKDEDAAVYERLNGRAMHETRIKKEAETHTHFFCMRLRG